MHILSNPLIWILLAATFLSFWWLLHFRERLGLKTAWIFVLSICHTLIGTASVKLFAALEGVPGGMSIYGAVFFLPVFYLTVSLVLKINVSEAFDLLTIPTISTLALARINCLISGCCSGIYIEKLGIEFPVREIEIIYYFLFWNFIGIKVIKNRSEGIVYPLYLLSYGLLRFALEFVRKNDPVLGPFHLAHIWSAISALAGAAAFIYIAVKRSLMLAERRSASSGRKV